MLKDVLKYSIKGYQNTGSKLFAPSCRFYPSCSEYAYQALDQHSVPTSLALCMKRLLKCHPWHPGGIDEVKKVV